MQPYPCAQCQKPITVRRYCKSCQPMVREARYAAENAITKAIEQGALPYHENADCQGCKARSAETYYIPDYSHPLKCWPVCLECRTKLKPPIVSAPPPKASKIPLNHAKLCITCQQPTKTTRNFWCDAHTAEQNRVKHNLRQALTRDLRAAKLPPANTLKCIDCHSRGISKQADGYRITIPSHLPVIPLCDTCNARRPPIGVAIR